MDWLAYRLADLSERERALLLALVGVVVPIAVAFLAVLPALEARSAARAAVAEAEALRGWVAERVSALPPEGLERATPGEAPEPLGLSALERSLVGAGLREQVAQLSNRPGGGVDLAFDAVPFEALTAWLAEVSPGWGHRIAAFRIERESPGLSRAEFTLEPAE